MGSARLAEIEARPQTFDIDLGKSAVIVVDMQNDFGARGGLFDRAGLDISGIQQAVEPTARVVEGARRASIPIVYLKMGFQADLSDLGSGEAPNRVRHLMFGVGEAVDAPDGTRGRMLIRDTWNTQILVELAPKSADIVLYKHRFSGFFETELDSRLQTMGARDLIFTGCTTSVCVESTIRDAMYRDYRCLLLEDCAAEPIGHELPRTNHDASLLVIEQLFGWISSSEAFISALERIGLQAPAPAP